MKLVSLTLAVLLAAGCSIQLEDKRLTREEVIQAFQQRDQAIDVLANAVKELQGVKKNGSK